MSRRDRGFLSAGAGGDSEAADVAARSEGRIPGEPAVPVVTSVGGAFVSRLHREALSAGADGCFEAADAV